MMNLYVKALIAVPLALLSFTSDSQAQFLGYSTRLGGNGGRLSVGVGNPGYGGGGYGYGGGGYGYGGRGYGGLGGYGYPGYGYGGGSGIAYSTRVGNGRLTIGTGFNNGYGNGGYGYGSPYYGNSYGSNYGTTYASPGYYSSGVSTPVYSTDGTIISGYTPSMSAPVYTTNGTIMTSGTSTLRAMPSGGIVQASATTTAGTTGKYTVVVPEKAKVWFNGAANDQTGSKREFAYAGSGQVTIKVSWKNGDKDNSKELMVNVNEGEQSTIDLTPLLN